MGRIPNVAPGDRRYFGESEPWTWRRAGVDGPSGAGAMSTEVESEAQSKAKDVVSRNIVSSLGAKGLYLVSRVFLPPLILSQLSLEEYGVWATCFILIGYLGMGAFGVSSVYVRYTASYAAKGEYDAISRLVSTGVVVVTAVNLLLLVGVWFLLPTVVDMFHVEPSFKETAQRLLFITTAVFLLDLSFGVFEDVLTGLQEITKTQAIWVVTFLLEAVLIVALLLAGLGIWALMWAFVVRYGVGVVASVVVCRRTLPQLSVHPRNFDRSMLKLFYRYGGIVQVSGLLSMFMRSIEKVLAGAFIGVRATGLFDVGEKLPMMGAWLPTSFAAALMPASSDLHTKDKGDEIRKLYLKGCRYNSIMSGLLMGAMAAFAAPLLVLWIGPDEKFQSAAIIMAWFALPYQLHTLTGPGTSLFKGMDKPEKELVYPVSQLILVAVTVGIGLLTVGKTLMMIVVTVSSSMILSSLIFSVYANHQLGVSQRSFLMKVLLPGLTPYVIGFALASATGGLVEMHPTDRLDAFFTLALNGALYVIITPLLIYRLMCDWGEREFLRKQTLHSVQSLLPRRWRPA